ncbi:MAG: hypothetical protein F4W92_08965 [Gammaproteobacteria bacterium]|nr:hypothetical protein [Gammaproteobacteria bacterium]
MRRTLGVRVWLCVVVLGLGLCVVFSVCVLLIPRDQASPNDTALEISDPGVVVPSSSPMIDPAVTVVDTLPQLPRLDFPPGSVEEACKLNEFPLYWVAYKEGTRVEVHKSALESVECRTALENSIKTINPYLWGARTYEHRAFAFIVLDEPLSFERIFTDPSGDLVRVQDALSRPECSLKGEKNNQELKDICHAESFFNYAIINHLCFGGGYVRTNWPEYYRAEDNPTLKQDRVMWKQSLEVAWLREKCEKIDPKLKITEVHPSLYELMSSPRNFFDDSTMRLHTQELLIRLAAKFGDDAAGLTEGRWGRVRSGGGYKFGRFAELLDSKEWESLIRAGAYWRAYNGKWSDRELSIDNFFSAFNLLAKSDIPSRERHDEIQFDWRAVVQHLCVPIYERPIDEEQMGIKRVDLQSCKEIVHEIRQKGITFPLLISTVDKFERVALELGVYE